MAEAAATRCPGCQRLQAQLDALRVQFEALQATVAQLQERLAAARKDSSTSSKPPSSDIVKPAKAAAPGQPTPRPPGGQPGHAKCQRTPFPPEQVAHTWDHRLQHCPECGQGLRPTGFGPKVVQQVDAPGVTLRVEERRCHEAYCCRCDKVYHAP